MRKYVSGLTLAFMCLAIGGVLRGADDPPPWAYGYPAPPKPGEAAPACADAKPISCARPSAPPKDDGTKKQFPESAGPFTVTQAMNDYGPADWYPGDHPTMPDIVAHGREKDGLRACGLCHYPNGKGKPENAPVAGTSVGYFMQQMADFKSGARKSADPRKANTNEMIWIAKALTDAETKAAAEYFAAIKWTPWIKVVEAEMVPKTRQTVNGLFLPLPGNETEPIGQRIIEVPENPEETDPWRNPRSGFIAYVPVGSIKKGEVLVTTGGTTAVDGKIVRGNTTECGICHGADLMGNGDVPGIAGRQTSYTVRQLYDLKAGTRNGAAAQLMKPVVANLSDDDMIAMAAYLASLK